MSGRWAPARSVVVRAEQNETSTKPEQARCRRRGACDADCSMLQRLGACRWPFRTWRCLPRRARCACCMAHQRLPPGILAPSPLTIPSLTCVHPSTPTPHRRRPPRSSPPVTSRPGCAARRSASSRPARRTCPGPSTSSSPASSPSRRSGPSLSTWTGTPSLGWCSPTARCGRRSSGCLPSPASPPPVSLAPGGFCWSAGWLGWLVGWLWLVEVGWVGCSWFGRPSVGAQLRALRMRSCAPTKGQMTAAQRHLQQHRRRRSVRASLRSKPPQQAHQSPATRQASCSLRASPRPTRRLRCRTGSTDTSSRRRR
jgi:hypothetical protein